MIDLRRVAKAVGPRFTVGRRLGRGGYGDVFDGKDVELDRAVAIKAMEVMPSDISKKLVVLTRDDFIKEAKVLAGLNHPHIVQLYDYAENEGLFLLIMELLNGGTLQDRDLTDMGWCAATLALAAGCEHAHNCHIMHRDINPNNVLTEDLDDGRILVKFSDYGLSKYFDGTTDTSRPGAGTRRFMAPEQVSSGTLSAATDVYAIALCLYWGISRSFPFPIGDPQDRLSQPPSPLPDSVPRVLNDVILKALCIDAADRYQTVQSFAMALAAAAFEAYGRDWLSRSGAKLHLEDEVREAASGGSS